MTTLQPRQRRIARDLAGIGFVVSAVMLAVSFSHVINALPAGTPPAGAVTLNKATGTSVDNFQIIPPTAAACPGSGDAGYRYQTYIVPASVDVGALQWSVQGSPTTPAPGQSLRNATGTQLRSFSPAIGNDFLAQQTASFAFTTFANLVPGDYLIGFACTLPTTLGNAQDTVRFWSTPITITASAGSGPHNFTYGPTGGTTTTTPTTTTPGGSTTTTVAGSTTTVAGSSTTTTSTVAGTTTTTTAKPSGTTTTTTAKPSGSTTTSTTTIVGSGTATTTTVFASGGPTGGGSGSLPSTGSSPTALIVWGVLLIVFGRMAILFGRKPKVV